MHAMDDDTLARAWESFAPALADVPKQREYRARMAYLMRGTSLADFGVDRQQELAMRYQAQAMQGAMEHYRYSGIRPGILGLGIMI